MPKPPRSAPIIRYAFSPMHKAALGVAFGLTAAAATALATIAQLVISPDNGMPLTLGQYFHGCGVTPFGVAVGAFWAFIAGFVVGWFLAFLKKSLPHCECSACA